MNKKKISFTILLAILLFTNSLQAENNDNFEVFLFAEQMPGFPNGERELFKFLTENIQVPTEIQQRGINGRVVSQFVVNSDGSISDIKIIRSLDPLLDVEVVRVIESMPKWIPGKRNGEAVNVQYTLPVRFQIEAQEIVEVQEIVQNNDTVFTFVERMPEFPGGQQAMNLFLHEHIRYPIAAFNDGAQGRVAIRFVVNADGSISNIEVVRSVHPNLDAEAMRTVKLMPNWIPGKRNGEAVRVQFTMPITFRLQ